MMNEGLKPFTKDAQLWMFNPIPTALLTGSINPITLLIYSCILSRALLSQKNGWCDEQGRIFVRYTVPQLCEAVRRGPTTVKKSLADLEKIGLIRRERQSMMVSHIFVNVPESSIVGQKTADNSQKPVGNKPDNCPGYGRNTGFSAGGKVTTSKYNKNNKVSNEENKRREVRSL